MIYAMFASAAILAAPRLMLCDGWSQSTGTIEHVISLYPGYASFDGQTYDVKEGPTFYRLTRHGTVADMLRTPRPTISINRLTGSYAVLDMANAVIEWSRPEDPGCVVAHQKF